jgi:membrane protein
MSGDDAPTPNGPSSQKKGGLEGIPVVGPTWSWYRGYSRRNGALLSAGIAYYGLFSLAPLMLLTLQITGLFIGESTAQQELSETLEAYLGPYLADSFSSVLLELQGRGSSTTLAVIGILLLIYGATKLFLRLQASFNIMWDIQVRPTRFSFRRVLSRLFAFTLVLAPTVILVVSLVLNAGISWLESITGASGPLLGLAETIIPFLLAWGALIVIFVILPDIRISWRDCWLGALFTAVLCALGTWLFGTYLSWSTSQKYSGSVGALIALIVWVDFMAIITILGVRLNRLLYEHKGKAIRPYEYAARIRYFAADGAGRAPAAQAAGGDEVAPTREPTTAGEMAPTTEAGPAHEEPPAEERADPPKEQTGPH